MLRRHPRAAWVYTILTVILGWVWFRTTDLSQAGRVFAGMAGLNGFGIPSISFRELTPVLLLALLAGCVLSLAHVRILQPWIGSGGATLRRTLTSPAGAVATLVLFGLSLLTVASGSFSPFLYFRF